MITTTIPPINAGNIGLLVLVIDGSFIETSTCEVFTLPAFVPVMVSVAVIDFIVFFVEIVSLAVPAPFIDSGDIDTDAPDGAPVACRAT